VPKYWTRDALARLGQLIDLISNIKVCDRASPSRAKGVFGRVYEYFFLSQFASLECKKGGEFRRAASSSSCRDARTLQGPGNMG
jgi:type I restriction enzyme M protein